MRISIGVRGLASEYGRVPRELTSRVVDRTQGLRGTMLGSSRGPQDVPDMAGTLERMGIGVLFTIGGDGTLKGAHALTDEIRNRGLDIAVEGIPKTIDNDISRIQRSFGFETAVTDPARATQAAHTVVMNGRTDMVVGFWKHAFAHVPIPMAVPARKKVDPEGPLWRGVVVATGQPVDLR